jgi:hypothetical protein
MAMTVLAAAPAAYAAPPGGDTGTAPIGGAVAEADDLVLLTRDGASMYHLRRQVAAKPVTGKGATRSDFDGDGIDDIAAITFEGAVVTYSSAPYRDFFCPEHYQQCSPPIRALTSGDFDGDGFDDLVVGIQEFPSGAEGTGGVWVLPGSPNGLNRARLRHLTLQTNGIPGDSVPYDQFGEVLATGDITGDGRDDLAIGVANKAVAKQLGAGAVVVLQGSTEGISTARAQWLTQNSAGVPGTAQSGDVFGFGLAIGKVDKDRYADLIVGSPGEDERPPYPHGTGSVTLLWGGKTGVTTARSTTVTGKAITGSGWRNGNYFWFVGGGPLAVTDTNGDGFGEVHVGSPSSQINNDISGAVLSFPGRATGLSTKGMRVLSLDTPGVVGTADSDDGFGASLAAGDVTGDGRGDLLVGIPGETVGKAKESGAVLLLRGSTTGLTGKGSQFLRQGLARVPGTAERGDAFGRAVALLNLDGKGGWDALVGTPGEKNTGDTAGQVSGEVTPFIGAAGGLNPRAARAGNALGLQDPQEPLPARVQAYGTSFATP